jgi:ABC-type protease/lipase transport system fused ATPase/permease subunit
VATVLGMLGAIRTRWLTAQDEALDSQMRAGDRGGALTSLSRALRLMFQSLILAVGAYLAVKQQISPGTMIAASILMARALAPVEMAVAHWAAFQGCRQAWARLKACLKATPQIQARMDLPAPSGHVTGGEPDAFAPGADTQILKGLSFDLPAGSGLGIIGPTGAGKSTLARAIVGAWPAMRGTVRLNGAAMDQWDPAVLGAHLGYLPQEVELFDGTVAENISRFSPEPDPRRSSRRPRRPASTTWCSRWPTDTTPRSAKAAPSCRPASASASAWPGRSTATRRWWCSTNPIPISTPKASRRSSRPWPRCASAAAR